MDAAPTIRFILGCLLLLTASGVAAADTPSGEAPPPGGSDHLPLPALEGETAALIEAADMSPSEVFDHVGLSGSGDCLDFSDTDRLRLRTRRWSRAVRLLAQTHPDTLYGWLLGRDRPPKAALREARRQRDCLLDQLVADSLNDEELTVNLELGDRDITSEDRLRKWAEAYQHSRSQRRRMRRALTESRYRSSLSQAFIWRRKYLFHGRNFNRISPQAAKACNLTAGHTWKPDLDRHERCWEEVLTGSDREREILSASSAPGVSRHHWGTEFDLFGLNPVDFRSWGPLYDEYQWMEEHALSYGFFQSYGADSDTYMEERWHWSYYPIAQALTDFAADQSTRVDGRLNRLWDRLAHRFNRGRADDLAFFDHIRDHWKPFMFDITVPEVSADSDRDS